MFSMRTFPSTKEAITLKLEAKLNKARHPFSKEVSWNIPADIQPILLEDARKRSKNVYPYISFIFLRRILKTSYEVGMIRC